MNLKPASLALLLLASACATVDRHEEPPLPEGVEDCLRLQLVSRMEIIDNSHILFHMRDGSIYNNHLSHRCPGLRRNDTIMYRTTLNQLCSIDSFTVLETMGGGFMPGPSCTLGKFFPTSEEEAEELRQTARRN